MDQNAGMGKSIWRAIRYLTNDTYDPADFEFESKEDWWKYWKQQRGKMYSYRWVCRWLRAHPNADVWSELFQKDPYLKELCKRKKIILYDQLIYYGNERFLQK